MLIWGCWKRAGYSGTPMRGGEITPGSWVAVEVVAVKCVVMAREGWLRR